MWWWKSSISALGGGGGATVGKWRVGDQPGPHRRPCLGMHKDLGSVSSTTCKQASSQQQYSYQCAHASINMWSKQRNRNTRPAGLFGLWRVCPWSCHFKTVVMFQGTTWYVCSLSLKNMNPIGLIPNLQLRIGLPCVVFDLYFHQYQPQHPYIDTGNVHDL